jgi:hydrogenase/urease accessory protein HupE
VAASDDHCFPEDFLMPALVAWLIDALIVYAGSVVGRALISLGFAWLTYTGLDTTLSGLKGYAVSAVSGLSVEILGMMGVMKVGPSINIVVSALATRMLLDGLAPGGKISKLVKK